MKKAFYFIFILILTFCVVGCKGDAPGGEIQIGREYAFSGILQVKLVNGHNGYSTVITDETDMANIISFVEDTVGKPLGSGKGYYEGSYTVVFSDEEGKEFLLTYGDDNVFYMGTGDDGYPIRYRLIHQTIAEDIIPFFSRYDQSGMDRETPA